MEDQTPKISVIIPVYNVEEQLSQCLQSILHQTYTNLEIFLIDDGSTDRSGALCDAWAMKDERIQVVHQTNEGVSSARNQGLERATGEWITFVDGDDYIDPNMYESLLTAKEAKDCGIIHCGYQMEKGEEITHYYNTNCREVADQQDGLLRLIKGTYEPSVWNKLFCKQLIKTVRFDERFRYLEDCLFCVQAFMKCEKTYFWDRSFYHYVMRENSAAHQPIHEKKIIDPLNVLQEVQTLVANHPECYQASTKRLFVACLNACRFPYVYQNLALRKKIHEYLKANAFVVSHLSCQRRIEYTCVKYLPWFYAFGCHQIGKRRKSKY